MRQSISLDLEPYHYYLSYLAHPHTHGGLISLFICTTGDFGLIVLILFAKPNLVFYQLIHLMLYFVQKAWITVLCQLPTLHSASLHCHFPCTLSIITFYNNPQWDQWSGAPCPCGWDLEGPWKHLPGPRSSCCCLGTAESRQARIPPQDSLRVILCLPEGGRASKRFWRRMAPRGVGSHSNRSKPFQTRAGLSEVCSLSPNQHFSLCCSW